ncbi:response regulator transcription factor [Paenibacillus hexagrammi]|uniref:Response regulator n=1 Tax=Paenibacillus hexagrammi TaxID=2908839 RepID=A0ABY3SCW4_9BACL|nr:response regulator [Paenibacillus sp. YPD9-1]UJF31837.1 response regulator [Paenibacillus sp. YPD9-1]
MIRVVIADDELMMRSGLRSLIDWKQYGMSVVAECSNGKEVLEVMDNEDIQILITDIQMPLVNGLQLMKQSLERNADLQVILVSSYDEFAYVQEGIRYGAIDYLFKPTLDADQLANALSRCVAKIEQKRIQEAALGAKIHAATSLLELDLKQFLLGNKDSIPPNVSWLSSPCVCMYMKIHQLEKTEEPYGSMLEDILCKELQSLFYSEFIQGITVEIGTDMVLAIFPEQLEPKFPVPVFKKNVEEKLQITLTIGYMAVEGIKSLKAKLTIVKQLEDYVFFEGIGQMMDMDHLLQFGSLEEASELRNHDTEPASFLIHEKIKQWRERTKSPAQVKKEACQLLLSISYALGITESLPEFLEMINYTETLEDVENVLMLRFEDAGRSVEGYAGKLIAKALEYMTLKFREEINLQEVADYIHVSRSYFSLLFKRHTGKKFIDYLIELRIREAKRLLCCRDYKIYEVAEQTGFKDVKYFSKLFKRMTGYTPIEYREHQLSLSDGLTKT